jgi:hypothetical protein
MISPKAMTVELKVNFIKGFSFILLQIKTEVDYFLKILKFSHRDFFRVIKGN